MTFRPNKDRLVVRRKEAEKTTPMGLVIPDSAQKPQVEAEVVAVPASSPYSVGQLVVLSNKYAGSAIQLDGEDLLIVRVDDMSNEVLGVYEDDAPTTSAFAQILKSNVA